MTRSWSTLEHEATVRLDASTLRGPTGAGTESGVPFILLGRKTKRSTTPSLESS